MKKIKAGQKRAKKGTSIGGQWTKTEVGFGGALGQDADDAMHAFQEHRRRRVKVAKLKKKLAAGADVQGEINTLKKEMAKYKEDFNASRAKALSAGVKISASGDVVAGGKQYAKAGKVLIKSKPAVKPKPKAAAQPKPKPEPNSKQASIDEQISEGIDAFKEHRKWRVKVIGTKKKLDKMNPSTVKYKNLEKKLEDEINFRDAAKERLDKIRAGFPSDSGVNFKSNGDVVVNGVQMYKGGKPVKAHSGAQHTTAGKKATATSKPTVAKPKPKPKPKPKAAAQPKPKAVAQPKPKPKQVNIDEQISEGIDAFEEHRKWRAKVIGTKKKLDKMNPSTVKYKNLEKKLEDEINFRDEAKDKLDKVMAGFAGDSGVNFKPNGDVVVNGVQMYKGGKPVKAYSGAQHTTASKKATAATKPTVAQPVATQPKSAPTKPSKKTRPPRMFKSISKAHDWQNKYYGGWVKGLSKAQADALTDYIGFPSWATYSHPGKDPKIYVKLNHGLAGDTPMTPKLKKMAKHMDAALDNTSTPYDIVVHRGFNSKQVYNHVKNGTLTNKTLNSPKATKRYSSTAFVEDTADSFMNYKPGVGTKMAAYPVKWQIEVPKGSHGAPISFAKELKNPYADASAEFLLPRDTTYELISAEIKTHPYTGQQVAYVKVRVAGQVVH